MLITLVKPKIPNITINNFETEYQRYLMYCKGKKKKWATLEGFQLEFSSSWSDLKKAYYVFPGNIEVEKLIKQKYKVIEEHNDNY